MRARGTEKTKGSLGDRMRARKGGQGKGLRVGEIERGGIDGDKDGGRREKVR